MVSQNYLLLIFIFFKLGSFFIPISYIINSLISCFLSTIYLKPEERIALYFLLFCPLSLSKQDRIITISFFFFSSLLISQPGEVFGCRRVFAVLKALKALLRHPLRWGKHIETYFWSHTPQRLLHHSLRRHAPQVHFLHINNMRSTHVECLSWIIVELSLIHRLYNKKKNIFCICIP